MRALAIDYGTKNIGVALSDEDGFVAGVLGNIANYGELPTAKRIIEMIDMYKVDTVVLGFPYTYRETVIEEGKLTKQIRRLRSFLEERTKVKVEYWDESYSSQIVEKNLRGKAKAKSDSEAARLILQEYLDHKIMMKRIEERNKQT